MIVDIMQFFLLWNSECDSFHVPHTVDRKPLQRASLSALATVVLQVNTSAYLMMFFARNGTITHVNCAIVPDSDVSGVGVRGPLYLQAGDHDRSRDSQAASTGHTIFQYFS